MMISIILFRIMLAGETGRLQDLYNNQFRERVKADQEQKNQLQEQIHKLTDSNFSLYESYAKGEIDADCFFRKKKITISR